MAAHEDWVVDTRVERLFGKDRALVVISFQKERVASFWIEVKANRPFLSFRTKHASKCGQAMEEWDKDVALAAVVAAISSRVLPDETLIPLIKPKNLVPGGWLPYDRSIRTLFRKSLSDIKTEVPGALRWKKLAQDQKVVETALKRIRDCYRSVPDVKAAEAMTQLRENMQILIRFGTEFKKIKEAWDEETVRSVQES